MIALSAFIILKRMGTKISAKTYDNIKTIAIGRIYNALYETKKLKNELWIDIEKAKKVGGDAVAALEKLEKGQPLEVFDCLLF